MITRNKTNNQDTVLFLHIPKCAGTTLTEEVLKKTYKPREIIIFYEHGTTVLIDRLKAMSRGQQKAIKCIAGHFAYGIHEFYTARPVSYITALREPIDRVVSHYYYVMRRKDHYLHEDVLAKELTLKQYVESGASLEMDNGQTRILAGIGWGRPFGECGADVLERAKSHLRSFAAVGITEDFDRFLGLLGKKLGWAIPHISDKNVTQDRLPVKNLDEETLETIQKYNRLDMELYGFATELFHEQLSEAGG